MKIYLSGSDDPFFHLAVEEWLLRSPEAPPEAWFLYRNRPSVVLGRFQNPWKECDLGWLTGEGHTLVRRPSGGGTVWHDPGNVNFCHVRPLKGFNKDDVLKVVQAKLQTFNLEVRINARHDLIVMKPDGTTRKVSGSAYKQTKDRALHHGTLLLEGDLDKLERSLTSPNTLLETRSIASVRSRVQNLHLSPAEWIKSWGEAEVLQVGDERFDPHPWSQWSWVYGETPFFRWEFQVGEDRVRLSSHKGIIRELEFRNLEAEDLNLPLKVETFEQLVGEALGHEWGSILGM